MNFPHETTLALRIFKCEHYLSPPVEDFDRKSAIYPNKREEIRNKNETFVASLRIFGSTPTGQNVCLHVHDVYPYFYVMSPTSDISERFIDLLTSGLNEALTVSLNSTKASNNDKNPQKSSTNSKPRIYVHRIEPVSAISFYGYCTEKDLFLKISFYNPGILKRAGDLLQNGTVMNFAFQPYELHIPFLLQFFIDYNLYGMDFVYVRKFKVRRLDENFSIKRSQTSSSRRKISINQERLTPLSQKVFDYNDFKENQFLDRSVKRQSCCELEFDCLASDILNSEYLLDKDAELQNPGLQFIWKDEKIRRRSKGLSSQLDPPSSPGRPDCPTTESEIYYSEILKNFLEKIRLSETEASVKKEKNSFEISSDTSLINEQSVIDLSQTFDTQDLSLVNLLVDMQEQSQEDTAPGTSTNPNIGRERPIRILRENVYESDSDEDMQPNREFDLHERLALEKQESFEMTQRFDEIVRSSSDDEIDEIAQLDGPPTIRKKRRVTTPPVRFDEEVILDSDSDSSSFQEDDIRVIYESPRKFKEDSASVVSKPRQSGGIISDDQVWLTLRSKPPIKRGLSDKPELAISQKSASDKRTDDDVMSSFPSTSFGPNERMSDSVVSWKSLDFFLEVEDSRSGDETRFTKIKSIRDSDHDTSTVLLDCIPGTPPTPPLIKENLHAFRMTFDEENPESKKRFKVCKAKNKNVDFDFSQSNFKIDSQLDGPSLRDSFGFNSTEMNLGDAQVNDEDLHLCSLSMELCTAIRTNLNPDPEFDEIRALFYCVYAESKHLYRLGMIFVQQSNNLLNKQAISFCKMNNVEFLSVLSETVLFDEIVNVIRKFDPDILIGYEIQQLSWGYLIERASVLKVDLCSKLSRIPDASGQSKFSGTDDWWSMADLHISGRTVLNLWRLMRHELTLNIYTFENVAYHLLRIRCPKFAYRTLTVWFSEPAMCQRVFEYFAFRAYGDLEFVIRTDLINRTCEFARIFGIQFFDVLSRGSQFRVESMMIRLTKRLNFICVSPSVLQRRKMAAPECIPLTMEPESKFYTDPILVLDFQSLYPSMCIAYNYCYSTCLGKVSKYKDVNQQIELGCCSLRLDSSKVSALRNDIHISPAGVAFVTAEIRRGVIPVMLEEILNTRFMIKQCMKEYKQDKNLMKILDARQMGLKLIANVTYGYTSANFSGRMPCVEIADSIAHKGRETLERAIKLVNESTVWNAKVVYGDTDSMFVLLKGRTKEHAFKVGNEIAEAVTRLNPKPVKLKFEKVYYPCVLQTKKRYVGYAFESLDQIEPIFDAKGIETVRRDTCSAVSKMLEKCLHTLFKTKSIDAVKEYTISQFQKILHGRVSPKEFIFAKEYRGKQYYSKNAVVPALVLAKRKLQTDRRAEPRIKDRIPYVVVAGKPNSTLISCVRDPLDAAVGGLRLNYNYYIVKQIGPALNRVFSLLNEDVLKWYSSMPKSTRPLYNFGDRNIGNVGSKSRHKTLSQYFRLAECPCCRSIIRSHVIADGGFCDQCRSNRSITAVEIERRCGKTERKSDYANLCCRLCTRLSIDRSDIGCVSLDCPVFYKRLDLNRDLTQLHELRKSLHDLL